MEVAPALGLADAVVDLVETGTTMQAAGLEAIGTLMETETVLIANRHSTHLTLIKRIHKRIEGYILATKHSMISYNLQRDQLRLAIKITPGHESPTVMPLDDSNMVSITALIATKDAADIMDQLKDIGAQSIVMLDVTNCRF